MPRLSNPLCPSCLRGNTIANFLTTKTQRTRRELLVYPLCVVRYGRNKGYLFFP
jgi:hypothetical protein